MVARRRRKGSGMSEGLASVLERASVSAAFRELLARDPEAALAGYTLTADERATLLRGDPRPIRRLHVERRTPSRHDRG